MSSLSAFRTWPLLSTAVPPLPCTPLFYAMPSRPRIFHARAQMEQHYNAVVQKNDPVRPHQPGRSKRGRPTSPRKGSAGAKSPRKASSTGSGSKKSPRAKAPSSGRSRAPSKGKATKKKKKGSTRRRKSPSKSRGRDIPTLTPRRVYSSARAFLAEHFPPEERQVWC